MKGSITRRIETNITMRSEEIIRMHSDARGEIVVFHHMRAGNKEMKNIIRNI